MVILINEDEQVIWLLYLVMLTEKCDRKVLISSATLNKIYDNLFGSETLDSSLPGTLKANLDT
jgi:hypothetical protein